VQRFRGGLVCKARRLLYHSTLGLRVINTNENEEEDEMTTWIRATTVTTPSQMDGRFRWDPPSPNTSAPPSKITNLFQGWGSECGTYKTVKARSWPWLQGKSPENVIRCPHFARNREVLGRPLPEYLRTPVKNHRPVAELGVRCRANVANIRQSRPWLQGKSPENVLRCSHFARNRKAS